jgi:hypothetical protein
VVVIEFPRSFSNTGRKPSDPGRGNFRKACGLPFMKRPAAESRCKSSIPAALLKLNTRKDFMADLKATWERNSNPMNFRDVAVNELENPEVQTHEALWDEPCSACGVPLWACQCCEM